jgi:toxin secretion/phage lysis holin
VIDMETIIKTISAFIGAVTSFLFGEWSPLLGILVALVFIDYASGIGASGIEGKLNSSVGMKGIARKVAIFLIVAVAHMLDVSLGYEGNILRDATIFFYLANEVLSIIENAGRIGLPVPEQIRQAVEVLKGKSEKGEDK